MFQSIKQLYVPVDTLPRLQVKDEDVSIIAAGSQVTPIRRDI